METNKSIQSIKDIDKFLQKQNIDEILQRHRINIILLKEYTESNNDLSQDDILKLLIALLDIYQTANTQVIYRQYKLTSPSEVDYYRQLGEILLNVIDKNIHKINNYIFQLFLKIGKYLYKIKTRPIMLKIIDRILMNVHFRDIEIKYKDEYLQNCKMRYYRFYLEPES